MHFFVLKENIDKPLSIIGRNISTKPQIPILANVFLKTEKNQLKIISTDLELGISFTLGVKTEKEGEITVPGKLLAEFISNLTPGKIEFVLKDKKLQVKTNKTKAYFSTVSTSDFPSFPKDFKLTYKFKFEKIKNAIQRTVFAASSDEGRPVLTGVKVVVLKDRMTFTATDGYRLSRETVDISKGKDEFQVILPARSIGEVVRVAQEMKTEEISFYIIKDKNQAVFSFDKTLFFTRVIEGEFPNVDKIVPDEFKTQVVVEKERLAKSIKTASLFARGAANIVKIKIEKDGLRISAASPQIGENEDFVEAKVEGEEGEGAFNFRFLLDLFNNFPEEKIIFESSGPLTPGVFKPLSSKLSFLHIVMPVRIQGEG